MSDSERSAWQAAYGALRERVSAETVACRTRCQAAAHDRQLVRDSPVADSVPWEGLSRDAERVLRRTCAEVDAVRKADAEERVKAGHVRLQSLYHTMDVLRSMYGEGPR